MDAASVSADDQLREFARAEAQRVAVYWQALIEGGVPHHVAARLTENYQEHMYGWRDDMDDE